MENMPQKGIATSVLLIAIGIVGYVLGGIEGKSSVTALIPAFAGALILISSLVGLKNLKLGMHLAALFGLLSFLAPLGRLVSTLVKGSFELGLPTYSQISMVLISGVFVLLCVKSFIDVRKARELQEKAGN